MKRFLSIILSLVMVLSMLPTFASAEGEYTEVGTVEAFKKALESNGDMNIVVTKDIIYTCKVSDIGDYWITLGKGEKTLNLNGKSVELNAETGVKTTMIKVPAGANLIIKDTSGDNSGTLFCYGKMESAYSEAAGAGMPEYFNSSVKYRNVLEIDGGMVTVNGGTLEAGRSKKMWVFDGKDVYNLRHLLEYTIQFGVLGLAIGARYDGYAWQQVNGDCITVNNGTLMINDGIFLGRGFTNLETYVKPNDTDVDVEFSRSACLRLLGGNTIINGGTFYGKGNADVLAIKKNDANFTLKNATLKTNHLRVLLVPTINVTTYGYYCPYVIGHEQRYGYKYHPASDPGNTGLRADMLDPQRNTVEVNGEVVPASEWTYSSLGSGNDAVAEVVITHHLSNSDRRNYMRGNTGDKEIGSAAVLGTMAQGMELTSGALKLSASNVRKMDVEWYHNGSPAEDDALVGAGDYQAKITLTADTGYKFTNSSQFTVMGYNAKDVEISSTGKRAYIRSKVYSFVCDHSLTEDPSIHFDEENHYQICTVCGEKLVSEKHTFSQGEVQDGYMRYNCQTCDYYIEKQDDGKIKIQYIDLRIVNPGVGKKPDYQSSISAGEGVSVAKINDTYTKDGVKWIKAGTGFEVGKDDLFASSMWYKANIYLDIEDDYALSKNEKDEYDTYVYVNGSEAKYEVDGNAITVYYEYTTDDVVVSSIDMCGIDWPEIGNTPDCTVESAIPEYYGLNDDSGAVSWYVDGEYMDKTSKFEAGKTYSIKLYVDAVKVGWDYVATFNNSLCATVDGFNVKTENIDRLHDTTVVLTFEFPTLEEEKEVTTENPTETEKTNGAEQTEGKENPFVDVKSSEYYYEPVLWAVEQGITGGTSATTFSPNNPCTRAQVVTFLHRMVASPEPAAITNPFTDVKTGVYYYKPVMWAVGSNITGGTSATTFSPDATCTRGQVVTFLWRCAGQPEPKSDKCDFTDISSDSYYYKAVLWAVEEGITGGTSKTTFSPNNPCTRAQVVTFMYRMINK